MMFTYYCYSNEGISVKNADTRSIGSSLELCALVRDLVGNLILWGVGAVGFGSEGVCIVSS